MLTEVAKTLHNRTILIIGVGSLGTALITELLRYRIRSIRVLDISEKALYDAQTLFQNNPRLRFLLGDMLNSDRLGMAMADVDYVIVCAAVKSVDIADSNPMQTVEVNVNGTFSVIREAYRNRPKKVILLSSDKALLSGDNTGVYHASKYIVEEVTKWANKHSNYTKFSCVRPANFVPSSLSVFEKWYAYYLNKKPIPVTDEQATRYFIPIQVGALYVLQALALMVGGEIFIPPARKYRMLDLAKKLKLGYQIIGLRPGDRLAEDLISVQELNRAKKIGKMLVIP